MAEAVIKVGTWGANGGSHWDMGPADHIKSIKICAKGVVDSIAFMYVVGETAEDTPRYGGPGGAPNLIKFFDEEYLTAISGYIGEYGGTPCISQLTFTTNMGTYGPYGDGGGTPFNLPVEEGKIARFYGRAGTYLKAIGVYLKPN
ncbi:horcolin-like [Musa acuminata AAA Group]|uniref:horcolin-like n=1 Tax=Musa acuminata AAA Group TaxID=214697 RepID=UPI0031DCAB2F